MQADAMMFRSTGHIIDLTAEHERIANRPMAGLVGMSDAGADHGDRRELDPVVLDQTWSQSCVWFAATEALFMRGCAEREDGIGSGIPRPSPMQAWTLAQWQADAERGVPPAQRRAINQGSRISSGCYALRQHGIVSADRWPFPSWDDLPKNLAGEVLPFDMPLDVSIAGADALLTGDYGASSSDFPMIARRALRQKHFPIVAFELDQAFMDLHGGYDSSVEWSGLSGPSIGRHCMVVVAWRSGWLLIKNSCGYNWGAGGYAWIADTYLSSRYARDGAVFTAVPAVAA